MPDLILSGSWQACADAFLADMEARSGSVRSREQYASILRLFFSDPARSPDQYSHADVQAFAAAPSYGKRPGRPISISTRNGRVSALTSFYRFASSYMMDDGQPIITGISPTAGMRYSKPEVKYRAMSAEELERFFAAIPDTLVGSRDRAFFMCIFWTARRLAEILRLCHHDIEASTIIAPDGARPGWLYRYTGKGASRETRTAELPAQAYAAIDAYLVRSNRKATIMPDEGLFCSVFPGRGRKHRNRVPLTHVQISAQFQRYIKAAGLDDARHLTIHSLRHTAARLRYEAGSDIREIQQLLNHTSLSTTDRYLRTIAPMHDRGALLLEKRFGLSAPG